jgi:hypothetical protein
MAGETLWYDLLTLCDQAGYDVAALSAATKMARERFAA